MWDFLSGAPTVSVSTPPLVDSTVVVAIIGMLTAVLLAIIPTRKSTKPSAPGEDGGGDAAQAHDLHVAEDIGALKNQARTNRRDIRYNSDRIAAIERRLDIQPAAPPPSNDLDTL